MNKSMLIGLASLMGTAFGVVVGAVMRQPEINKLKKQVKVLQSNMAELEAVVERQNAEISRLYASYKTIGALQFLKKREAKIELKEALILQYATVEYLSLVLACASGAGKLTESDVEFYKAYGKLVSSESLEGEDRKTVERYVRTRHSSEIESLCQADTEFVMNEVRNYGKASNDGLRRLKLPFRRKGAAAE